MTLRTTPTLSSDNAKIGVIEKFSILSDSIEHLLTTYEQEDNKFVHKEIDGSISITVNSGMGGGNNTLTKNGSGDIVYEFNTAGTIQKFTLNKGENDTFKIKVQYADDSENEVVDKVFISGVISTLAEFLISHFSEYLPKEYSEDLVGIVGRHTAEIASSM